MNRTCLARQESDQMRCVACRLVWDMNDPAPPTCGRMVRVEAPPLPAIPERVPYASGLPGPVLLDTFC